MQFTPLSTFIRFIERVENLAITMGNALKIRGFKTGGAAGQVPRKVSSADFDWTWSDAASTWNDIIGKPSTFPPSAHTHTIANVTGLQAALNGKAAINSPEFTGTPVAPTASFDTETGQIATTEFVHGVVEDIVGDASFIRYDQSQGLDTVQQAQARTNVGFEQGVTLTLSGLPTAAGNIPDAHTLLFQHTNGNYYRSAFSFVKSSIKAETVNLTGNQTVAGVKTFSSPPVSTGTALIPTEVPNLGQTYMQAGRVGRSVKSVPPSTNGYVEYTFEELSISPTSVGNVSYTLIAYISLSILGTSGAFKQIFRYVGLSFDNSGLYEIGGGMGADLSSYASVSPVATIGGTSIVDGKLRIAINNTHASATCRVYMDCMARQVTQVSASPST